MVDTKKEQKFEACIEVASQNLTLLSLDPTRPSEHFSSSSVNEELNNTYTLDVALGSGLVVNDPDTRRSNTDINTDINQAMASTLEKIDQCARRHGIKNSTINIKRNVGPVKLG